MGLAAVAIVGGSLLSAYGQMQAGAAEEKASKMNALIAEDNAELTLIKAAEEERRLRVQGRKALGDIRASYGASGVTMQGSPMEVLKESAANVERDALSIKFEGESRAMAFRNEARLERYRGANAAASGQLGGLSSLLLGAGSLAKK